MRESLSSGEINENEGQANRSSKSSKEPVVVEPKTFFANERTFIQWISAALLLLTVSSIMMSSGNYNGTSTIIACASMVLVIYAAFVYFRRVKLLRSGEAYGYLDFVGPSILAAGVGVGVFIVCADAVKGSEFLPFGSQGEGRRSLISTSLQVPAQAPEQRGLFESVLELQEVDGKCSRYGMDGINLLEYEPRDIVLTHKSTDDASELLVATPQALVSHPLSGQDEASAVLSEISDSEIQSMAKVGDRLFALSTGPSKTELIELKASKQYEETESRFLIKDSASTTGSMVFVPSSDVPEEGKLYIYLDGSMHTYQLPSNEDSSLSRVGSINMKVLNRGLLDNDDPITAMVHFEGLTYVLRERLNTIEAWDLNSATLVAEMALPAVSQNDKWVGMAFQRRQDEENEESSLPLLRKNKMAAAGESTQVYLHMPLDTFPPQLWSFRLEEYDFQNDDERTVFSFPGECDGMAMN